MADLTYQEAIAELNRLKSIAGGPPTVAELQSIVSRTRVTLADTGLAADRAGVVRGAVLYSGVANSQVRTNDLAKALYQLDPSIAIIDETHIGKLLAGATFGNEALAAILRENPSFTVVQARDFINGTNGGFWSSASERFAAANANGKLVALVPNPTGFDPSRIFGSNEMKALMQGSGTGSINGIPLSELRLRYSALAPAGAAGALEDIAQIVSVKSLSDSWANISVDTSVSGSAPRVRFSSTFFDSVGIPNGTLTSAGYALTEAKPMFSVIADGRWLNSRNIGIAFSKAGFLRALARAGKIAGPLGDLIELGALTGAVVGQLNAGDRDGAARTAANGLGSIGGSALAAGVAATWAAPLLAGGPAGWVAYTIIVVGAGVAGSEVGQAITDRAFTLFAKTLPDYYQRTGGNPAIWIADGLGAAHNFITTSLPNGFNYAARVTRELFNGELDIVKFFTGDSPTPQEPDIIVTANRRTGQTSVSNLPSYLQNDPFIAQELGKALLDFARSGDTLRGGSAGGSGGNAARPVPASLAQARMQPPIPGQQGPATPVLQYNADGTITIGSFRGALQGSDNLGGFRLRDFVTGSLIDVKVTTAGGETTAKPVFKRDYSGKLEVTTEYNTDGSVKNTALRHSSNPNMVTFADAAGLLGENLGYRLASGDKLTGALYSATLKTLGQNLGEALDAVVFGSPANIGTNVKAAFSDIGNEFFANLKSAGIGAVSSYLTAELVKAIGVGGIYGEWLQTSSGAYVTAIIANLPQIVSGVKSLGDVLGSVNVGNIAGSFVGAKLAALVWSPDTIGGQIGAAVGAAIGAIAVTELAKIGTLLAGPLGAVVGAFVGFLIGGLIGSLFGGTPRSGADSQWDEVQQKFVVSNVYARKGGSKEAASSVALAVSETFNSVLAATGGKLINPYAVQSGNYGMRKKDFVYRPLSTRDADAITQRFSGKDAAQQLIGYGIYNGVADPDFKIAGGDVYVKRALYNSFSISNIDPRNFDSSVLFGNISVAQRYESYLANGNVINALVSAEPDSVFAIETLLILARADELGLTRRAASDWFGGFSYLIQEAQTNAAMVGFGFDYDFASGKISRLTVLNDYTIDDTIDIAGQTTIEGTAAADTIDLRSGSVNNQIGYTVNGHFNDDIAQSGVDFTAKSATISLSAGLRSAVGSVATIADASTEAGETFDVALSGAVGVTVVGPAGAVTIVAADALPTLLVGRSYAAEGDSYAIFRVSLSKAAASAVTLGLGLADGRATAGVDYAAGLEISADGNGGWTSATALTLAAGVTQYFVRVAVLADNGVDSEGKATGVEGNESFSLTATVTAGAPALANGSVPVSGKGTIIDGSASVPYVWIDDQVVHEGSAAALWVNRSKAAAGTASVTYTTSDRTRLDIAVAATVDGGDGNDTIYASNLGDNLFGGAGNDALYGGRLDDWLLGGDGDDVLDAGTADAGALGGDGNYLDGGAGNDILRGREGSDWLEGGDGVDVLTGGAGDDVLAGGAGDGDDVKGGLGDDQYLVRLGDGADISEDEAAGAPVATGVGDYISQRFAGIAAGTIKRDWIGTSAGVSGKTVMGGDDAIVFGQGIDIGDIVLVRSTTDSDDLIIRVMQTDGATTIFSGTQLTVKDWFSNPFKRIEWLKFIDGNEVRIGDITSFIVGGAGNDVLVGTAGNDFVYGGGGNDKLYLMAGNDIGNGGTGNDLVAGDSGRDLLLGGQGRDELVGGKGADVLSGDGDADDLYGGDDNDILSGGRGDGDQLVGGAGNDTFKYARGDGRDMMFDDFTANWQAVWIDGNWNTAAGYNYIQATGEVTGPDGAFLRKNVGTAAAPDMQWVGRFDYDSDSKTLRTFSPPAGAAIVANNGTDTIEFAPGINIQDIVLSRPAGSNDLVLSIASENGEIVSYMAITDSITIKDWYVLPGQIEKLAFYQTGVLDIAAGATNLIAGSDAADGTTATPLAGTAGADWITGGAGADVIAGGLGDDIIAGNSGSDTLKGEGGADVLYGGAGNDSLDGGAGADMLIGGAGLDTASYLSSSTSVRAYLSNAVANTGDAVGDQYSDIENLLGGSGADTLGGNDGDNELSGSYGNDVLLGGMGNDTYIWGTPDGADIINDSRFVVEVAVTTAGALAEGYTRTLWQSTGILQPGYTNRYYWRLQITGPGGEVVYDYDKFAPTNTSGTQPDPLPATYNVAGWIGGFAKISGQMVSREKFDTLVDAGDDVLEINGSISLSDLSFIISGSDLIVRVADSAASQITIKNHFTTNSRIETLQFRDGLGVSLASILTATSDAALAGTSGDDLMIGRAGAFADTLSGGGGNDVLSGGAGADILQGGDGDDQIEGGAGADQIDGGGHSAETVTGWGDTVRYVRSTAAVNIDLRRTSGQTGGDAEGDMLSGIENIVGSDIYSDTLQGDDRANRMDALGGSNFLRGWGGDDVLIAGDGFDSLYGDDGNDAISAGGGNDRAYGGAGNDTISGGDGNDEMYGDAGNDTLTGDDGNDRLYGGDGADILIGGAGSDTLDGGIGNDTLNGGGGSDTLQGGDGDDIFTLDAMSGQDFIIDFSGKNAVVFDSSVSFDQLWLTRPTDTTDLRIGVIGTTTSVTLVGYFGTGTHTVARSVSTTTHALFLGYSTVLIDAMTAAQAAGTPAAMPDAIKPLLASYWHAGGKAAPQAAPVAITINEDTASAATAITAIDPDENITGYALGTPPANGAVALNAANGQFVYTPNADFNGNDVFSIVVQDADGHATDVAVTVTVTPANDAPRALRLADGAVLSVVEGGAGSPTLVDSAVAQFTATDIEGDTLTYALADNAGGRFEITGGGLLIARGPALLDYESATSHVVRLRVTDAQGAASEQNFTVTVADRNEANALPSSYAMSIAENVAVGTSVGTITATDLDSSASAFGRQRYFFLNAGTASATSADGRYTIDAATGTIKTASALNFESGATSAAYTVIARDNDGNTGYNQVSSTVTIGVTDVNEANAIPATYAMAVSEAVAIGTTVGAVAATDLDSASTAFGQQRYFFLNAGITSATSGDGRYTIDAVSGVIKTAATLNYESGPTSVAYAVAARDNQGNAGYNQAVATVTIGVTDANEANSLAATYALSVAENVAVGTSVGTIVAVDPDAAGSAFGQQRYFFLNAGAASATSVDGRYTIDAVTGVIKTAAGLNFEAGTTSVAYTVVARDNAGAAGYNQASSTVTIGITDVNEANAIPATYAMTVAENVAIGTSVGAVAATDIDGAGTAFGQQRYFFLNAGVAGATSSDGRYTIDATTGVIKTAAALNFEAGSTSIAYSVVARDNLANAGYNQAVSTVTIGITDVNEANALAPTYAMAVAENVAIGTAVGTVTASDPDGAGTAFGQQRYYFLNAGVANATSSDGRYTIDALTGAIKTAAALNFEAGTTSVAYTVAARDNAGNAGYNQATSTVTIGVTDVNEANAIPASYAMSVAENLAIGTGVGSVAATDIDGAATAFGQQRYYFLNAGTASATSSDGRYTIDAVTGLIKTAAVLNFEAGTTSVAYTVAARDNLAGAGYNQATSTVTIGITDTNEANALPASYAMSVAENLAIGSTVGSVAATDLDGAATAFGQQRYYFLNAGTASATSSDGRYTVDAVTGLIQTAAVLNFEAGTTSVAYTVVARDNLGNAGYNQASSTVTIGVTDVNEANAVPATYAMSVAENVAIGTAVGSVAASDLDGAGTVFGQQRYFFLSGGTASATSSDGRYAIDAVTGLISTAATLNFEAGTTNVAYTVTARDNQGGAGYNQASSTVTIGITDINEANAIPASYAMSVVENAAVGTSVGTVAATDIDGAATAFGQQRYYFLNAGTASATSSDGRYTIDAVSGVIKTASGLNFEAGTTSVAYTVVARDNAGNAGYTQASSTVTIGIADVNEANAMPATYAMSVTENVAIGTSVGSVAATDIDGAGTVFGQQRYFFLNAGAAGATSSDGRYTIDAVTGLIKTAAALNFEGGAASVAYTVVARDNQGIAGYIQAASTVTIGIADVNEANAIPSSYAMSVAENVATGTLVGSVAASDADGAGTVFGQQRYYFLNAGTAGATSSDGRYTVDAVTGAIKTAAALNFEAGTTSVAYTVVARDNAGGVGYNQVSSTVTIGVTDVNEAPLTLTWTPSVPSVEERDRLAYGATRPAIQLGTLGVTDPDTAGTANATYSYTVSDARFEVLNNVLWLKLGASLDFEAGDTVALTITGIDGTGAPFSIQRTISLAVTNRDDVLEGDASANVLVGQQNRDLIYGYAGADAIDGGPGDDQIDGGTGADQLIGGAGNDALFGGDDADILLGGLGNDRVYGGSNELGTVDRLYGDAGDDLLSGDAGDDFLTGGVGADLIDRRYGVRLGRL